MIWTPHHLRVQRSRHSGFRMPAGAVYVGRPSRFGNPFRVFGENEYLHCDASHRRKIFTPWVIFDGQQNIDGWRATPLMAVQYFRRWLDGEFNKLEPGGHSIVRPCTITRADILGLAGKRLACWCSLVQPCHADVLAHLANGGDGIVWRCGGEG